METTGKPDVSEYLRRGYSMDFDIFADSRETHIKIFVGGQLAAHRRYWNKLNPEVYGQVIETLNGLVNLIREEDMNSHDNAI